MKTDLRTKQNEDRFWRRNKRLLLVAAPFAVAVLFVGAWFIWSALPEDLAKSKVELPDVQFDQKLDAAIAAEVALRDEAGNPVQIDSLLRDRPTILNLVYFECPMLCNLTMDSLIRTLNTMNLKVGQDFDVLTVSFDPREGPPLAARAKRTAMQRYKSGGDFAQQQAATGWHFLTGDADQTRRLADSVGFRYEFDESRAQYAHASGIIVLTPDGRISRYLTGVDFAARDVRFALVEASAGQIGSPTDQVLLLCYRYDPTTGKYGLAVTRAIRFLGILTIAAMVGGIVWMLRLERTAAKQPYCVT